MRRRSLLKSVAVGTASLAAIAAVKSSAKPQAALAVKAADEKPDRQTHTYKTVDKCAIKADVYGAGDQTRPVVIWIHGGALILGNRGGMDPALRDGLVKAGMVVVSIDYRLAPETKLPGILEDVADAYRWVRDKGPGLFKADADKIAVMGGSAGGYLTQTCGYRLEPRPRALVSFWGYGDIAGPWYSRPDPFYAKMPAVPKDEAYQAVGGPVLSEVTGKNSRARFYLYCRQQGIWPLEVVGIDPDKEPKKFDPYCPIRNITDKYPPTLLIHGTKDTDVPYDLSESMDKELAKHKVAHQLLTVTDAGHGLSGAKPEVIAQTREKAVAWAVKYLR
jgi:acetyl esterase/lipase